LTTKRDLFMKLSKLDVTPFTESKNGLDYLSWAACYAALLSVCDDVDITYLEDQQTTDREQVSRDYGVKSKTRDRCNTRLFRSGTGAEVRCRLTLYYGTARLEHEESLPVLKNGTKPMAYEDVTAADANKAAKRCFVKAAAHFGLGLNLYIKEDAGVAPDPSTIQRSMTPLADRLADLEIALDGCSTTTQVKNLRRGMLADEREALNDAIITKGKALASG
jgi:hypothetical protein